MKRLVAIAAGVSVVLLSWGCRSAPPAAAAAAAAKPTIISRGVPVTSMFSVDFQGISIHAKVDPYTRRAVLIAGDVGRQHTPILAVVLPKDQKKRGALIAKLAAVAGKRPVCNDDQCFVRIEGVTMRVRGQNDQKANQVTPHLGASFVCLVPELSKPPINGGAIYSQATVPSPTSPGRRAHLPSAPAIAFFDVENGELTATRFERTGFFMDTQYLACIANGTAPSVCVDRAYCRQFAHIVSWEGVTNGVATLQMASNLTSWDFEDIPVANEGPLMLYVENLANSGHMSTRHFLMNEKLLTNKNLPEIGLDCPTLDHAPCSNGVGFGAILAVPGCSDNTFP